MPTISGGMFRRWGANLVWLGAGWLTAQSSAWAIVAGDEFPTVKIDGYVSGHLDPTTLKNKVTVMNFWATWCEACKVELKEMETAFKPFFEKDDSQFQFVAITLDKDPKKSEEWLRSNLKDADKVIKNLFKDPDFKIADLLSVDSFPMTLIIGKDGKVKHVQKGFKEGEGSTEKIVEVSRELLNQDPVK